MQTFSRLERYAKRNRKQPTRHEDLLYSALLSAFKLFRVVLVAQEIIGPYIADFCIYPARVVVEVDGLSHRAAKQRAYDERRTKYLANLGMRVIRFTNLEVESNPADAAKAVLAYCGPLELKTETPAIIRIPAIVKREWNPQLQNIYRPEFPKGSKQRLFSRGSLSSKATICSV